MIRCFGASHCIAVDKLGTAVTTSPPWPRNPPCRSVMLLRSARPPRLTRHRRTVSMRLGVPVVIALLAAGVVATRADEATPKPAKPDSVLTPHAQSAPADSKTDEQELQKEAASARYGFERVDDG